MVQRTTRSRRLAWCQFQGQLWQRQWVCLFFVSFLWLRWATSDVWRKNGHLRALEAQHLNMTCSWTLPSFTLTEGTAGLTMDCRVGLRWYFCCGCPNSKTRLVLNFSSKKSGVVFSYFFEKSKNELVQPKTMFLAILAKNWSRSTTCKRFRNIRAYNLFVATS